MHSQVTNAAIRRVLEGVPHGLSPTEILERLKLGGLQGMARQTALHSIRSRLSIFKVKGQVQRADGRWIQCEPFVDRRKTRWVR